MNIKKLVTASIIFIVLLAIATIVIVQAKPQLHKTFMFEQIIYKRSTK